MKLFSIQELTLFQSTKLDGNTDVCQHNSSILQHASWHRDTCFLSVTVAA